MASERIQRQIDRLLDEAEEAVNQGDWAVVEDRSGKVLALDPDNVDALTYLAAAERAGGAGATVATERDQVETAPKGAQATVVAAPMLNAAS